MGYLAYFLIDVDVDASPIAGHIASDQDDRRPFHGWLELSSAIEERRVAGLMSDGVGAHVVGPSAAEPRGDAAAIGSPPGAGSWLDQCTQPRWMFMGAWTCAGWSAIAVPVLAATRRTALIAWWALGLLAMISFLTFLRAERHSSVDLRSRQPSARRLHRGSQ